MPNYISPLDDAYIRFDAAADILAKTNGMATPDSMLEMLVIAMWKGAFNPPHLTQSHLTLEEQRKDPENWLQVPIEQPRVLLTEDQRALKPLPFEYYEAGRDTIISAMYCSDLLPGESEGWRDMLEGGNDRGYLHDKDNAFKALTQLPLHCYSDAGRDYLRSIYVPRTLLQVWLDRRSFDFHGVFVSSEDLFPAKPSSAANDDESSESKAKRGRPELAAWEAIKTWAVTLRVENPHMPRKEMAGYLYERALKQFEIGEVPSESTIVRRLSSILGG